MRTLVLFMALVFSVVSIPVVFAQGEEDNSSYKLKLDDIRYDEPTPIPHVDTSDTILYGKDKAAFDKDGYVIQTSLSSLNGDTPLSFTISQTRVTFDPHSEDSAGEKSISISIAAENQFSYQIIAVQQKPLTSSASVIDNTICNTSDLPCTSSLGRPWDISSSYGFGYRLSGDDISIDFHDSRNYRPFALNSKMQEPEYIMANQSVNSTRQTELFFKLVFPPSYQEGTYTGDISIIALPKL